MSFCFARKLNYASMSSFIIPNLPALEMRQLAWAHLTVNVIPVDSCSRCWRSPGDSSNRPVQTWPSAGWPRGGSTDCVASLATLGVTTVWVCQAQTRKTTESCCPSSPVKVKLKYEIMIYMNVYIILRHSFIFGPRCFNSMVNPMQVIMQWSKKGEQIRLFDVDFMIMIIIHYTLNFHKILLLIHKIKCSLK